MITTTYNLEDLPLIAQMILEKSRDKTLLFYGAMGVGKTTLIKELVRQLGSEDNVTSPTFSLVNEYATPSGPVYHFDFYRIEDETEALDMGVEEYFDTDTWLFIEWPGKISTLLPENARKIYLERKGSFNQLTL